MKSFFIASLFLMASAFCVGLIFLIPLGQNQMRGIDLIVFILAALGAILSFFGGVKTGTGDPLKKNDLVPGIIFTAISKVPGPNYLYVIQLDEVNPTYTILSLNKEDPILNDQVKYCIKDGKVCSFSELKRLKLV